MKDNEYVCPHCKMTFTQPVKQEVIRKATTRFKWWVAPLNLIFVSILILLFNIVVREQANVNSPWSIWVISAIWLSYSLGIILRYRTESAWLIVPFFFVLVSLFIATIDWADGGQNAFLGLSWSIYPILSILTLFVILPVITYLGRDERHPKDVLREVIQLEEENV